MPTVRIATFNVENLYSRPVFWDGTDPAAGQQIGNVFFKDPAEGRTARRIAEATLSDDKCQLTAQALAMADADVVCLQEVDNQAALDSFARTYLDPLAEPEIAWRMRAWWSANPGATADQGAAAHRAFSERLKYGHRRLVEGNDRRGIDVAVVSRLPLGAVVTHHTRTFNELGVWPGGIENYRERNGAAADRALTPEDRIFKRDCLEVNLSVGGAPLTLFVCHFKSMQGGREKTRVMRQAEALAVREIVRRRFEGRPETANWAICGDLNDYREIDGEPPVDLKTGLPSPAGIEPLFAGGFSVDPMRRRAPTDRWTTYYGPDDAYAQLDYILLSPALAARNPDATPEVFRIGQPWRAARAGPRRLPRVGWDRPKASDHCPVAITLELG